MQSCWFHQLRTLMKSNVPQKAKLLFSSSWGSASVRTLVLSASGSKTLGAGRTPFSFTKWNFCYRKPIDCRSISYVNSYRSGSSDVPLLGLTVGQLIDLAAEKFGGRDAVVSCQQNIRKTYTELKLEVDKLAAGFWSLGLRRGDRIGIWSPNNYEWYLTQLAANKAGLILVTVNPAYQANELEYCLKKVEMNAIVMAESFKTQDYYKLLASVVDSLSDSKPGQVKSTRIPNLKTVMTLSDKVLSGTYKFDDVLQAGGKNDHEKIEKLQKRIQFDEAANIQFTSGTTGYPKGATLSHHSMINSAYLTGRRMGYHLEVERIVVPMPLYHCSGCVLGTLSSVIHGACLVLPAPSFEAKATAEAIQEERATTVYGTPTMYIGLLHLPDVDKYNFSSLKKGLMGGANCPIEVVKACNKKLNIKKLSIGYGCTETSPVISYSTPGDSDELRATTVGTVLDHVEIKTVDENGEIVPVGTPGELLVRGFAVMLGYWNDPQKTDEAITKERWYKTGDRAVINDKGYLQIVGRIKDMIIRGGENIYPRELEEFLHQHPQIAEVQVIGVPDKQMGEEVCAWIKLTLNQTMTEEEIKAFCRGKISHFKIPRYILFVDDFPKTVTGKIQKFIMVEETVKKLQLEGESYDSLN